MLLQIDDIRKTYRSRFRRGGAVRANDGITLQADAGQVYGLLGHNGAGKTTLANQIVGLLKPDSGTIHVDGEDLVAHPGRARQVCSLQPQAQVPLDGLTPRQAIDLLGQMRGGRRAEVQARRDRLAEALDIGEWLDTGGEKLSGGVKRLVSFAMAAVVPGRVVILDEPTNDVDPIRRRLLWLAVRSIADEGNTVLLVTHNVVEAEKAVDRLAIMDQGRVIADGTPAQLKAGHERELKLDLSLEPGQVAPATAPFTRRYQPNGTRAQAVIEASHATEAIEWAQMLRARRVIGEFSLTPTSLEDVYVDLVSRTAERSPDVPPAVHTEESIHARAA
jgi:ABC-2 type transport system ATP-binding protein